MNLASFLSFALVSSLTPGPNNIISMTNGSKYGVRKAVPYAAGVFIGVICMAGLAAFFGSVLYDAIPTFETAMRIAGSAYILFLAYTIIRDKPKKQKKFELDTTRLISGILMQAFNVKAYLYVITSMSTFILPFYRGVPLVLFTLLLASIAFMSNILWALFGSIFDRFFKNHKKILNIAMALLLVYCAVSMLLEIWS